MILKERLLDIECQSIDIVEDHGEFDNAKVEALLNSTQYLKIVNAQ